MVLVEKALIALDYLVASFQQVLNTELQCQDLILLLGQLHQLPSTKPIAHLLLRDFGLVVDLAELVLLYVCTREGNFKLSTSG